jgi:ABC-type branched-subunit amino acid transport system permease subunit
MLAGISGALVTLDLGVISPAMFGVVPSIEMVIWVAVGGRGVCSARSSARSLVNFGKDWVSSAFPELWLYVVGARLHLRRDDRAAGRRRARDELAPARPHAASAAGSVEMPE